MNIVKAFKDYQNKMMTLYKKKKNKNKKSVNRNNQIRIG